MSKKTLEKTILNIIKMAIRPLSFNDIRKNKLLKNIQIKKIKLVLNNCVKKSYISYNNNFYWDYNNVNMLYAMVMRINSTFGFVKLISTNEEVFIPGKYMLGVLPGDKVIIKKFVSKKGNLLEGRILVIVTLSDGIYFGKISKVKDQYIFSSNSINFPLTVDISKNERQISDGKLVKVRIIHRGNDNCEHIAKLQSVIGDENNPESCCNIVLEQNHIKKKFDGKVLQEARDIASQPISKGEYEHRLNLCNEKIFTIDDISSKDLDDAISIKELDNNRWQLGVHIADVSYYVKRGSLVDKEAFERGTSLYYADNVIPMLPKILSNGICSLNQNQDRLTFSVLMVLDGEGEILSYKFKKSIIRSKVKGVYSEINKILDNIASDKIMNKYSDVIEDIFLMEKLAKMLNKKRIKRGSLNLETPECKIKIKNNQLKIEPYIRGRSEVIIEEFMLKANEAAAMFAQKKKLPFIYRVHDNPPPEKLTMLSNILTNLNLPRPKNDSQLELSRILKYVEKANMQFVINNIVLRSLARAKYSSDYNPHYGLVLNNYSHFTSPIRRYPDLVIHQIMSNYLDNNRSNSNYFSNKVADIAFHSSVCEKNAEGVERECEDIYKAYYMLNYVNQQFKGVISSLVKYGFYVQLPNTIEGLVHKNTLPVGDYEIVNMIEFKSLKDNSLRFKIGDPVIVKLTDVDVFAGKINFEIVNL